MSIHSEITEFASAHFHSLARIEEPVCLSTFVPRAGGEQATLVHSKPALKDLLQQADDALRARGVQSAEIQEWLAPVESLLASNLWRGTEQTLAFFRTRSSLHSFNVPLRVVFSSVAPPDDALRLTEASVSRRLQFRTVANIAGT